jgi:hypothetical protein
LKAAGVSCRADEPTAAAGAVCGFVLAGHVDLLIAVRSSQPRRKFLRAAIFGRLLRLNPVNSLHAE